MPASDPRFNVPLRPANPSPPAPGYPWPNGCQSALFLSFDIDAESAWTSKDPANHDRLVTASYGGYEARVGCAKVLELLREIDIKGTFFVAGWTADAHPDMAEAILKDGHEIAHHGYFHLMPELGDTAMQEELERGFEVLKRRLGVVPVGYRAPYGEFTEELRVSLAERGILYSSSFRDDIRPYRHQLLDGRPGVIELPVSPSMDDWSLGLTTRMAPRPMFTRQHVLSLWRDEMEETHAWGGLVTTVLHPLVSGRPVRLRILREFLQFARKMDKVWFATGEEIAGHFRSSEVAAKQTTETIK